jgi:DNA-binding CsgD family transcriptional regulator/uncharacterized protein YhfF
MVHFQAQSGNSRMRSASTEVFWKGFQQYTGLNDDRYQVTTLRTNPVTSKRLINMLLAGAKRGSAGPMHYFGEGRDEPLPMAGDHVILLNKGKPLLIWRTRAALVAPLSSVTDRYVWTDGEGQGDRETWLRSLRRSFAIQAQQHHFEMHDDIETLFETLDVVWPLDVAKRLELVVPHLERSFEERQRLDEQRSGLAAVLERLQTAVFTLGGDMSLHYANRAAEVLLRRADGIVLKGRFVTARGAVEARTLAAAVAASASQQIGEASQAGGAGRLVMIRRAAELAPYRATVLRLRVNRAVHELTPRAEVLLFVDDPDTSTITLSDEALFRQGFQLTPAEARLAASLASGGSLSSVAETFGISKNTVRAQLQAVFDKTDTRRQSDLVRLLQATRSLRVSQS